MNLIEYKDAFLFLLMQDGTKVFTASCDKTAKMWDLASNQTVQIAQVTNFLYNELQSIVSNVCLVLSFVRKMNK